MASHRSRGASLRRVPASAQQTCGDDERADEPAGADVFDARQRWHREPCAGSSTRDPGTVVRVLGEKPYESTLEVPR